MIVVIIIAVSFLMMLTIITNGFGKFSSDIMREVSFLNSWPTYPVWSSELRHPDSISIKVKQYGPSISPDATHFALLYYDLFDLNIQCVISSYSLNHVEQPLYQEGWFSIRDEYIKHKVVICQVMGELMFRLQWIFGWYPPDSWLAAVKLEFAKMYKKLSSLGLDKLAKEWYNNEQQNRFLPVIHAGIPTRHPGWGANQVSF